MPREGGVSRGENPLALLGEPREHGAILQNNRMACNQNRWRAQSLCGSGPDWIVKGRDSRRKGSGRHKKTPYTEGGCIRGRTVDPEDRTNVQWESYSRLVGNSSEF